MAAVPMPRVRADLVERRSDRPAPAKRRVVDAATSQVWSRYLAERKPADRNLLIERYLYLVKIAALKVASRRPACVDTDDLYQYGVFGLRDAIASFDPERGVKFETYCMQRIRGAMLDGLKSLQWLPRDVKQRLNRYNETRATVEAEDGPAGAASETARRLAISEDDCAKCDHDNHVNAWLSLSQTVKTGRDNKEVRHMEMLADTRELSTVDEVQRRDVRELFLRELTRSERLVMMLYYYEQLTMREIGDAMGISGTRVSQMHSEIIRRLRERLGQRVLDAGRGNITLDF